MTAYGNIDQAIAGLKYGLDADTTSRLADGAIEFGAPVNLRQGNDDQCYPFVADQNTITYDADFVASNSIAASVNGVAITPEVFATDHATTFAAVVAAIDGLTGVDVISSDATARTILVETTGVANTTTSAVTLGASQAGVVITWSTSQDLYGVAQFTQKEASGTANYADTEAVNIMRKGEIWVTVVEAVDSQTPVYLTQAGAWTDASSGNILTPYVFRSTVSGAGLARIEVIKQEGV